MSTFPLVCVVDDALDYRFLFQQLFAQQCSPHSLALFDNGAGLMRAMTEIDQPPALILLDRHTPGLDGHQILLYLKEHPVYKKIPVVMMSVDASAFEVASCYEAGVNSYLIKSLNVDAMQKQVQVICQYWLDMNQRALKIKLP